jgi:CubicO group peptidase (beta-lactamase class C family)
MYRGYDPERNLDSFFKDAPVPYPRAVNYLPSTCVYDILGLLVSARHGKGCDDVAEELIFAPFGMKSASYGKKAGDRLYAGHYKYGLPMTEYDEARYPSLSFVADGRDLVRFFGSFLLEGAAESAYCPPWLLDPPELTGLGRIAWYAGKYYGHRSCVILAPELGIGALAITNSWAWDAKTLLYELCSSLLTSYAAGESGPQKRPMRFE